LIKTTDVFAKPTEDCDLHIVEVFDEVELIASFENGPNLL